MSGILGSRAARLLDATVAVALITYLAGWWAVAFVALLAGFLPERRRIGGGAMALASALGWGVLLLWHAVHPSFGTLLRELGSVFGVPGLALVVVTLLYAALVGWSGAELAGAISRFVQATRARHRARPAVSRYDSPQPAATAVADPPAPASR